MAGTGTPQDVSAIAGVDYGSKMAGTTVIAALRDGRVRFWRCPAKTDADAFLLDWCHQHRPSAVFLDAPLSLPGVYRGMEDYADYFFRVADRAVSAMSPMFLGGLTARAMQLHARLRKSGVHVHEVYPGGLAREIGLPGSEYKKSLSGIEPVLQALAPALPYPLSRDEVQSWHHVDALLAWLSGYRLGSGKARVYGKAEEGIILV